MASLSRAVTIGTAIAIILFFSACLPTTQLRDRAIVQAVGVDMSGEDCTVTLQVFRPTSGDQVGSGGYDIISGSGQGLADALLAAEVEAGKSLFYGGLELLMLGDGTQSNLQEIFSNFNANPYIVPTLPVSMVEGQAADMLIEGLEQDPAQLVGDMLEAARLEGSIPPATLMEVMSIISTEGRGGLLPLTRNSSYLPGKLTPKLVGGVMLNQDRVVGELDRQNTRTAGWILAPLTDFDISYPLQEGDFTLSVDDFWVDMRVDMLGDGPHFWIEAKVSGQGVSPVGGVVMSAPPPDATAEGEELIASRIEQLLMVCYGSGCDILRMGERLERDDSKTWELVGGGHGWNDVLSRSKWQITTELKLYNKQ